MIFDKKIFNFCKNENAETFLIFFLFDSITESFTDVQHDDLKKWSTRIMLSKF